MGYRKVGCDHRREIFSCWEIWPPIAGLDGEKFDVGGVGVSGVDVGGAGSSVEGGGVGDGGVCDDGMCGGGMIKAGLLLTEICDRARSSCGIARRLKATAALLLARLA